MSVNKVIILGNVGKEVSLKTFDNGKSVATFSLATSEKYKDKTGNQVSKVEWHNIQLWSPLAEIAEKYIKKGNQVYIEGKIETREYTDKEGNVKRITEIIGRELNLIGGKSEVKEQAPIVKEQASDKKVEQAANIPDVFDDLPF